MGSLDFKGIHIDLLQILRKNPETLEVLIFACGELMSSELESDSNRVCSGPELEKHPETWFLVKLTWYRRIF